MTNHHYHHAGVGTYTGQTNNAIPEETKNYLSQVEKRDIEMVSPVLPSCNPHHYHPSSSVAETDVPQHTHAHPLLQEDIELTRVGEQVNELKDIVIDMNEVCIPLVAVVEVPLLLLLLAIPSFLTTFILLYVLHQEGENGQGYLRPIGGSDGGL